MSPKSPEIEWQTFLQDYQRGAFPGYSEPPKPEVIAAIQASIDTSAAKDFLPVYRSRDIDDTAAGRALRYYSFYQHLAPPASHLEAERTTLAKEYVLDGPAQLEAMNRYASLMRNIFGQGSYAIVSLFDRDNQIVHATSGDSGVDCGAAFSKESTICSHAMLRKDGQPLIVNDLWADWRFKGNPFCIEPDGARGYIGIPIMLPIDPTREAGSTTPGTSLIPVGVIALMTRTDPLPALADREMQILDHLAQGLSRELECYRTERRRRKELSYRVISNDYLNKALVQSSVSVPGSPIVTRPSGHEKTSSLTAFMPVQHQEERLSNASHAEAVDVVFSAIDACFVALLDISMIHRSTTNKFGFLEAPSARVDNGPIASYPGLLAHRQKDGVNIDLKQLTSKAGLAAVTRFLQAFGNNEHRIFHADVTHQASHLESLFGKPPTTHMVVPLFSASQPHLLFIAATFQPQIHYVKEDVELLLGIGAIVQASILRRQLIEADRAKTTFISQVTHELRTPLHGLITQLDFIGDAAETGQFEDILGMLHTAQSCGVALSDVINDVLDFGKISISSMESLQDHDQQKRAESRRNMFELVEGTVQTCLAKVARQQKALSLPAEVAELVLEYEDRPEADWLVNIDAAAVQRVLFNLLTNAIKYCKTGAGPEITLSLRIVSWTEAEMFEIVCQDRGLGMSQEFLAGLFQPFRQANAFAPGAGLGLFITASLIRRLEGTIAVESGEGRGTTFTIHLPVHRGVAAQAKSGKHDLVRREYSSAHAPLPRSALRGSVSPSSPKKNLPLPTPIDRPLHPDLRILVVDDNSISRSIMVTVLQKLKASFRQASDGIEGYAAYESFHPQLVWTDVSMPRQDGITSASRMRLLETERGWKPAYIIALTGLGSADEFAQKEAIVGQAKLDEWQIKGQTKLASLRESVARASSELYRMEEQNSQGSSTSAHEAQPCNA